MPIVLTMFKVALNREQRDIAIGAKYQGEIDRAMAELERLREEATRLKREGEQREEAMQAFCKTHGLAYPPA